MRPPASVLMCGLMLLIPGPWAQDTEIRGARISLKPISITVQRITIENRRNSPLVAWEIGLFAPGASQPSTTYASNFSGRGGESAGAGPIGPNGRRVVEVQMHRPDDEAVALRMVVFADGFSQGTAAALARWRQLGQERAGDLAYWIRAIATMPRESSPELRQYLAEQAVERAGQVTRDPSGLRERIGIVTRQHRCWSGTAGAA